MKPKFRVWDKEAGHYLTPENAGDNCAISLNGQVCVGYIDGNMVQAGDDEMIIQQFTGIQDANGEDIYEGDIVSANIYGNKRNLEIIYQPNGGFGPKNFSWYDDIRYEVVGNVIENPDLLP